MTEFVEGTVLAPPDTAGEVALREGVVDSVDSLRPYSRSPARPDAQGVGITELVQFD